MEHVEGRGSWGTRKVLCPRKKVLQSNPKEFSKSIKKIDSLVSNLLSSTNASHLRTNSSFLSVTHLGTNDKT